MTITWVTWSQEDSPAFDAALSSLGQSTKDGILYAEARRSMKMVMSNRRHEDTCEVLKAMQLKPTVQWGYDPQGAYTHEIRGEYTCYTTTAYESGALHSVLIGVEEGPLTPGGTVYYRVGDADSDVWSDQHHFKMAPVVGEESLPYRLGLIGDLGQTEHSLSTLEHISAQAPDSVMFVGDLSYADGYHPRWDTWGRMVSEHTSQLIWMYTEGNHEIEADDKKSPDFLAYMTRFKVPYEHSGSSSPLYYSYEVAGAHIIMLGSYAEYGEDSEQVRWLIQDLSKVNRNRTPWVLVGMHAPWYNSNHNHQGEGEKMRKVMEPILYQYGVDAIISGHVHAYERSEHVYNYEVDECGPMHLNIGDGGNREGLDFDYYKQPDWSAFREPSYGHGIIDLLDATHARFTWHRNQDGNAEIADSVLLHRDPKCRTGGLKRLMEKRQTEKRNVE